MCSPAHSLYPYPFPCFLLSPRFIIPLCVPISLVFEFPIPVQRKVVLPSGPATWDGNFHVKMPIMLCKFRMFWLMYSCTSNLFVIWKSLGIYYTELRTGQKAWERQLRKRRRINLQVRWGGRVGGKVIFHVTEVTPVLSPEPHQEGSGQDSVGLFFCLAATLSSLWPHACLCKLWPRLWGTLIFTIVFI